jgi:hypothetical protein
MDLREKLSCAIETSVHWYDALCEVHAVPGERHAAFWINRHSMPPYMSNFVTLTDCADADAQRAAIRGLRAGEVGWGVKDSFQCLELHELGMKLLFQATWVFRPADVPIANVDTAVAWRVVQTAKELQDWERTWRGTPGNGGDAPQLEVFREGLLRRSDFRFLLGERDGQHVAVAALNRSRAALGLSNVLSATLEPRQLFPGCAQLACSIFPGVPLVGYEREQHLAAALETGFEAVHGLSVWVPA